MVDYNVDHDLEVTVSKQPSTAEARNTVMKIRSDKEVDHSLPQPNRESFSNLLSIFENK